MSRLTQLLKRFRLPPETTAVELRKAYFREAKLLHPDRNPSSCGAQAFAQLNADFEEAQKLLQEPECRRAREGVDFSFEDGKRWSAASWAARSQAPPHFRGFREAQEVTPDPAVPVVGLPPEVVYTFTALASAALVLGFLYHLSQELTPPRRHCQHAVLLPSERSPQLRAALERLRKADGTPEVPFAAHAAHRAAAANEILEEVLRDDSSALDLVSALPLPCRERIVAAHATLVFQTRSRPLPPHLVAAYLRGFGDGALLLPRQGAAATIADLTHARSGGDHPDDGAFRGWRRLYVVEPELEGPADLPPVGQPVSYGPPSSSAGGRPFIPAAMDDDSEEVVAPTAAMVAQISDSDDDPPTAVIPGDLPSTQITNVAPNAVEPVVVAAEPIPASNDTITMAPSTAVDLTPATPGDGRFPQRFATVPRAARAGDACPPATTPARLEEIQRQIDAELASAPPPPLPPQDAELDRLHVAALQETRDNAQAAARLEAAIAANGEEYVAYKARVERRGARAEHLPAPSSDLARLLVSTYGDLVRREEATADGAVMPRAAEAPYWVLTALPTGVWGGRIPGEDAAAGRFIVGWCAHRTDIRRIFENPPAGPPSSSTLQWLQTLRGSALWPMDPPPRAKTPAVDETISEDALEPALEWVLKVASMWRHDLRRRRGVVQELKSMVEDMEDTTKEWDRPTQVPLLLHLLRDAGYPDVKSLSDDLSDGFDMLGEIKPWPGQGRRQVLRPGHDAGAEYLFKRLPMARPGAHADALLAELVQERRLGRVIRPARAPPDWPVRTVALPHVQDMTMLVEPPDQDIFVAASFPIIQVDENGDEKLRRGEDWRRSGHNSTVKATDVPTRHFVGDFVDLARRFAQWAVKHPAHSGTFLATEHGVTLWFHLAMCFGAAASVWNFNRAGDALQVLLRHLLLLAVGHYVDDFNALDFPEAAQDAHDAFSDVFSLLGLKTKASKAQPPQSAHTVQGVLFEVTSQGVRLSPTERRRKKLLLAIEEALSSDQLAPHVAHRLAGKLAFLTQAIFGALGKAALKPIYARSADAAAASDDRLSLGLRAALMALRGILRRVQPRFIPFQPSTSRRAVLYADAFFQEGDVVHKAGFVPRSAQARPADRWTNGWGFVLVIDDEVFYSRGVVPAKAFIYVLEIVAQLLPLLAFGDRLPSFWTAYIDNAAGQWALLKGYGKDDAVNGVLSAFWASAARHCWFPEFVRVPSKANISDAVSRDDLRQASAEGWSWLDLPGDDILNVLLRAADDLEFATDEAASALASLSSEWSFGAGA
ncbi:unnamed protein product [Symbiodinium natans]|uniref:J domain-containing protein n=1 Tax=Symbiodinium natans TaxID=878477 RepID=A0A812PNZ5_9DINO|nr:unnamed protein product [Symbiodinium natans]